MNRPVEVDRVLRRLPRPELERRWAALRTHMQSHDLEAVVAFSSEDFLGGYVRWLTDRPSYYAYGTAAVFHRDDLMSLVEHGFMGTLRQLDGRDIDYPGVGELHQTSAFHSVRYTQPYEAQIVADILRRRGYGRVGLAGRGAMPSGFLSVLLELDGIEFSDETDVLDALRAIKSPYEQEEIRRTAAMQDRVFEKVLAAVRPGIVDAELCAVIQAEGRREGSEQGVVMIGSAPAGQPAIIRNPRFQNRRIEKTDQVTVLIENNGPCGFYTELGRIVSLGEAPSELKEATGKMVEAQQATLDLFRPGARCADIARAHDAFMVARGFAPETRLYAHGQGYSLVERPLIRADETMSVQAGMSLVAHPATVSAGGFAYVCDNYLVAAEGPPERLHRTPQHVFELDV
jgi:Xaa-Pro aminopeptidase